MKPRNAREREIMALHQKMPDLTEAQRGWIRNGAIPHRVFENGKGQAWCSKCGNRFAVSKDAKLATCPHCGARLPIDRMGDKRQTRKFADHGDMYLQFLKVRHGYQVIQYYSVEWRAKRGEESHFTYRLVMEKWCQPGRPTVTLGVPTVMLPGWCRIPYSRYGLAAIKSASSYWYQEWMDVTVYPRVSLLPIYKKTVKNARYFAKNSAEDILAIIYSNPYFERLYKAGNAKELKDVTRFCEPFWKYWPSIRVALRHGFKPKNWSDYLDYLSMLAFLHKDMRSPHYVAPDNYPEMHSLICAQARNKRMEMQRRREEKEAVRRAEQQARLEEERKEARRSFPRRVAKFKDLNIVGFGLVIRPLMSIQEFADEGNAMGHCVFSNAYYNKPQSLILSARAEGTGKRVETIEVDLSNLQVLQSRGRQNLPTEKHDEIIELVKRAMPTIDAMAHPKSKRPARGRSQSRA